MMQIEMIPRKTLFFDTETTGFRPGNICQLSYIVIDGAEIKGSNYFFTVPYVEPGAQGIHGLSVGKLKKLSNNKTFKDKIDLFKEDFHNADLLIGHNISFDLNFIISEYKQAGYDFYSNETMCTMKHFTDICKIPKYNGYGYKWPKLEELTSFLDISHKDIIKATEDIFDCKGVGYHDARFDTVATYLSYMKGSEKGLIVSKASY